MTQLPLPLAYAAAGGRGDYFVSTANADAAAWLAGPPGPRTLLVGPPGSGKSHLAAIFAARGGVATGARAIDDADRADQTALFHAWNAASADAPLLLTARAAPRGWVTLPDLASRLAATPTLAIAEPDDALLLAVLVKQFADRGVRVAPEVAAFVAVRIERSFASLATTVAAIDARALAEGREVTVPLARDVIEGQRDWLAVIDVSPDRG